MVTLPCIFRKTHGKVTKNQQQNSAFAVRFWPRRTAKRVLYRAFLAQAHSKDLIFAVRFAPRRTAKGATRCLPLVPSVAFFCRAS
jgi:hypothetical protein